MKGRLNGSPSRVGFATPLAQRVFNALDCENPGIVSSAAVVLDDWRIPGARPMGYSRFNGLNVRWDRVSVYPNAVTVNAWQAPSHIGAVTRNATPLPPASQTSLSGLTRLRDPFHLSPLTFHLSPSSLCVLGRRS
jgi:hypothetical protein